MGTKLAWTGLAIMLILPLFGLSNPFVIAGAIVMAVGVILMLLNN